MENFDRTLDILVNGRLVRNYARARLFGKERLGLYASLFMLSLWNIPEDEYLLLSRAHEITIKHGEVILASGAVADVFRYSERKGTEVQVAFSPGLMLWGSSVSLDVEAGTRVSEIVSQLLDRSGAGVELLSFPGEDPIVTRGQAFFGRASECVMPWSKAVRQIFSILEYAAVSPKLCHKPSDTPGSRSPLLPGAFRPVRDSEEWITGFHGPDRRGSDGTSVLYLRTGTCPEDRPGRLDAGETY